MDTPADWWNFAGLGLQLAALVWAAWTLIRGWRRRWREYSILTGRGRNIPAGGVFSARSATDGGAGGRTPGLTPQQQIESLYAQVEAVHARITDLDRELRRMMREGDEKLSQQESRRWAEVDRDARVETRRALFAVPILTLLGLVAQLVAIVLPAPS